MKIVLAMFLLGALIIAQVSSAQAFNAQLYTFDAVPHGTNLRSLQDSTGEFCWAKVSGYDGYAQIIEEGSFNWVPFVEENHLVQFRGSNNFANKFQLQRMAYWAAGGFYYCESVYRANNFVPLYFTMDADLQLYGTQGHFSISGGEDYAITYGNQGNGMALLSINGTSIVVGFGGHLTLNVVEGQVNAVFVDDTGPHILQVPSRGTPGLAVPFRIDVGGGSGGSLVAEMDNFALLDNTP